MLDLNPGETFGFSYVNWPRTTPTGHVFQDVVYVRAEYQGGVAFEATYTQDDVRTITPGMRRRHRHPRRAWLIVESVTLIGRWSMGSRARYRRMGLGSVQDGATVSYGLGTDMPRSLPKPGLFPHRLLIGVRARLGTGSEVRLVWPGRPIGRSDDRPWYSVGRPSTYQPPNWGR